MNLAHLLRQAARRYPSMPGFIRGCRHWTWAEIETRVDRLAHALTERGLLPGDRVLVQARNGIELVETMFACFRAGAVWVPTNFRQSPAEIAWLAQSSGARFMICETEFADHARACAIARTIFVGDNGPGGYEAVLTAGSEAPFPAADVEADTPCWFFYTSGTTGRPKAAVLTHGQMGFVVANHLCDLMPALSEHDASLVIAPLTHGAGVHFLMQVARGTRTILPEGDGFDAAEAWRLVEQWRVTNMFTVPTILKLLVEHSSVHDFDHASLRHVIYAGAPMYRTDQKRALATLGPVLVQYFGLGEVTGAITVLRAQDHAFEDDGGVKLGTCGRERTGMQVSIQDDRGQDLPSGATGEICVCGPAVFAGYHDNPQANAAAFRNGWFRTGDIGFMDAEGDLFITGRASDMYISGGSNVYPREIEDKILAHPSLLEAAVFGVPDPLWGEVGIAACVLRKGADVSEGQLLDWMKQEIAGYKVPKRVLMLQSLPKSGYGKVDKKALAALHAAGKTA
ncbi:MAG: AMP-binding protein [Proteobacteria bacterium]|nr:AMP-binding protein [Pseudomonadota bacterium]